MTASTYMDIWLEQQSGGVSRQPLPWLVHGGHLMGQFRNMMKRHMHDLESSINVQQKLLPEQPYVMDGAEIAVRYLPMMGVSGDASDKVFGIQRLSQVVEEYGEDQSEVLAAAILSAASRFSYQGWKDDVTLVVIKT